MRIVFFGTPYYVLPILNALHKKFMGQSGSSPICAVVTQTPKPKGRNKSLEYSPVDKWAHSHAVPVYYDADKLIKDGIKGDLGILESYGSILTPEVINYFPQGIINAHPSLLPKYRGASPAQAAILCGEKVSGATIIKLDKFIDHGKVIWQFTENVLGNDTAETLRTRIFDKSVDVLINLVEPYQKNKIKLKDQDHNSAIMTYRINKEDAFISPKYLERAIQGESFKGGWKIPFIKVAGKTYTTHYSPTTIDRFIRAMNPWPGAWTEIEVESEKLKVNKRFKILKAHVETKYEIRSAKHEKQKTPLKSRTSYLVLDEVQLEGKNPVTWELFKKGYPKAKFD